MEKISEETDLPEGVEVINLEEEIKEQQEQAKQIEGTQIVGALLRGQQAYYLENSKFSDSFEELGLGIQSETDNFKYEISLQGDKSAMITAQAKDDSLKSYTGAVFATEVNGESTTVTGICETDEPSEQPPAMPKAPGEDGKVECPSGSSFLQ